MSGNKIYLDSSTVLHWLDENKLVVERLSKVLNDNSYIYTSCLSLLFAETKLRVDNRKKQTNIENKLAIFDKYNTLSFDYDIRENARRLKINNDFEDACQVATAQKHKMDLILTSDLEMFNSYKNIINIQFIPYK